MDSSSTEPTEATGFAFRVLRDGPEPVLDCAGTFEGEACERQLELELSQLHELVLSTQAAAVTLDIQQVEYVSSGAIRVLGAWFTQVGQSRAYTIRIVYHPDREWQVWSLGALRMLAPGRIRLEAAPRVAPVRAAAR